MAKYIEAHHEVTTASQIVDVRPFATRAAEALTNKFNLCLAVAPALVLTPVVPLLSPLVFAAGVGAILTHQLILPQLPLRYPVFEPGADPKTKKKGDGILYMGALKSASPYEKFKQLWVNDDDLRRHMLIMGTTGSGKSELLKAIFYNALCWSSGFFCADGKADNKLPTDALAMARMVGRDDDVLFLNFLLGGKTPEQVRRNRVRRTNRFNPFSGTDADTIIQMGANMLPKVEGEGKNWQEKALNLWRAMVVAVCYRRDKEGVDVDVGVLIDYLSLPNIEKLYLRGYEEVMENGGDPSSTKDWSYGYVGIKAYLDSGCPSYNVEKLLAKHGLGPTGSPTGRFGKPQEGKAFQQDNMASEQHAYRTSQLLPILNLLDKTYGHIFSAKYSEINMVDVTLNNRILAMLIPSLEKSSQEAENLGKLGIACLRVMMGRNLGADIEGSRQALLESKATKSPVPYVVALDELGYYFADGIAVIFAQARSLGFCMIAAGQDLEKLTEGPRASETGAMLANQALKAFLRIKDHGKTMDMVEKIIGKAKVVVRRGFESGAMGFKKSRELEVQEVNRVTFQEMQGLPPGEGLVTMDDRPYRFNSFYMGDDLEKKFPMSTFWVNRFLQVPSPTVDEVIAYSLPREALDDPNVKGEVLRQVLTYERAPHPPQVQVDPMMIAAGLAAGSLSARASAELRAVTMYQAAKQALIDSGFGQGGVAPPVADGGDGGAAAPAGSTQREVLGGSPGAQAASPRAGSAKPVGKSELVNDDLLDFLDDAPFERKPAADLLDAPDDDGLAQMVDLGGGSAYDTAEMLLDNMKSFNVVGVEDVALQRGGANSWVRRAVETVNESPVADVPSDGTAVGFTQNTIDSVTDLESLLGNAKPQKAAKALESAVSRRITPSAQQGPLDPDQINDFFDTLQRK